MTNADPLEDKATELQLWMLPLILFQMLCSLFANHVDRLKQMRSGPLPKDWEDHFDRLMDAEWPMQAILAEGARRILAGQDLDYASLSYSDPPPDQGWIAPASAWQTHLRMEALARFMADPEAHIRRHAARILAREAAKRFGLVVADSCTSNTWLLFAAAVFGQTKPISAQPTADRIRAPP